MHFDTFLKALRKVVFRRKLHHLAGIMDAMGKGAYFLTSACRSLENASEGEVERMRESSEEADRVSEQVFDEMDSYKVGVGTKRKKTKKTKKTKKHL